MKKAVAMLFAVLILAFFAGCAANAPAETQTPSSVPAEATEEPVETQAPTEAALSSIALYDDMSLELCSCSIAEGEDGREYLVVEAVYRNDQEEPFYALCSFAVKAFQDNVELEDGSDINGADADLIKEVRNGAEIAVTYRFVLNGRSDVQVLICEPTANETILAGQVFTLEG